MAGEYQPITVLETTEDGAEFLYAAVTATPTSAKLTVSCQTWSKYSPLSRDHTTSVMGLPSGLAQRPEAGTWSPQVVRQCFQ